MAAARELFYQLGSLLHKEALLIWRSKKWFIAEIIVSLLMLPLIVIIVARTRSDFSNSVVFDPVRLSGGSADVQQQVKNIARIYTRWCGASQTLAYTGANSDELMRAVQKRYPKAPSIQLRRYADALTMKTELIADLNVSASKMCGNYLGGIIFDTVDVAQQQLSYRVLFPRRMEQNWWLSHFWTEEGPYSAVADLNNIPGEPSYWSSGFLSIQFAIENAFLDASNKSLNLPVFLQRMPSPQFRNSGILAFLKQTPILWSALVLMTMIHAVKNIVAEKEAGIKTYMNVMGLNSIAFYASHFMVGVLKVLFIVGICASVFAYGLTYVSASLFVVFSLLFAIAAIAFALLISTAVRRPTLPLIATPLAWVMLIMLDTFYATSPAHIAHCFLVSLNVFTAFKLGVKSAIMSESTATYLGWTNVFASSTHSFSFGFAMLMVLVDICILTAVALYLDAVWPTDDSPRHHPLFLCGYKSQAAPVEADQDEVDAPNENVATDGDANYDEADIDVRKVSKVWEQTGQMAIENLSFRAFRGQVTVLLGQNGAGKSTTFSVLSGSTRVTSGSVLICRDDMQQSPHTCQRHLGYCPQYNPLFARLTVREHLRLYAKLKYLQDASGLDAEISTLVEQVKLTPELDKLAENLSGGMKRKLCVAMALIGNSRVILLDEPTAGMDLEARRDVRQLLSKAKKNRTVLLTTHYIDEAEALGDRLCIMVKGRLMCNGSSEFLKTRFGTGYLLTFVTKHADTTRDVPTALIDGIVKVVHKHIPDARLDSVCSPQFSLILPVHQKSYFANLFEELEVRKDELQIESFGLSFNTLEQVFLRVGELCDSPREMAEIDAATKDSTLMFTAQEPISLLTLWQRHMSIMLWRHALNVWRNKARTLMPVAVSLFLFAMFIGFGRFNGALYEKRDLSLTSLEPVSIPLVVSRNATASIGLSFVAGQLTAARLVQISPMTNLSRYLMEAGAHLRPPLGVGAVLQADNSALALFSGAAYHSAPAAVQLITNAALNKKPDSIKLGVEIYDVSPAEATSSAMGGADSNLIVALIVILAFSSLVSTFAMPLVEEKQCKFKHQLLLSKLSKFIYWLSYVVWHIAMYVLFCATLSLLFFIFSWMSGCMLEVYLIWALYAWCTLPFVYCASFVFDSPVKAYAALLNWNVVVSLFALIADVTLEAMESPFRNEFHAIAFVLLPSFSLGNAMVQIAIHSGISGLPSELLHSAIRQPIWCMLVSGVIFWCLLIAIESKRLIFMLHTLQCRIRKRSYQVINGDMELHVDDDVLRERDALRTQGAEQYALAVQDMYKCYGRFCAVRGLTFGVRQTDCFGLLGVNGAGKTTAFSVLTGDTYADAGSAFIGGVDVRDHPIIGYCPQFDALAGELTGHEILTLFATLNGFDRVPQRVSHVLHSVRLARQADKIARFYSGGQKRRLSIGVTLMTRTSLIMLDEPTAGIDASTRRSIWQLLTQVRQQGVAILLTSHSMEECEALCNRIGFMNKGALISIGTSQHLKSRYGNTYLLTYTLDNPNTLSTRFLDNIVTSEFKAASTTDAPTFGTQHWEIPRNANQQWSEMFRKATTIAEKYASGHHLPPGSELPQIKDFTLTQNSLEHVFLRLAEANTEESSTL